MRWRRRGLTSHGRASLHRSSRGTGSRKRTPCTTMNRRGDVVLVPLDFTDRAGTKWRPAVIVSVDEYQRLSPDVVIASVTSNLRAIPHPGDHQIADWRSAG